MNIIFDGLTRGKDYTAPVRAGRLDQPIRLERSKFAHGDVAECIKPWKHIQFGQLDLPRSVSLEVANLLLIDR